MYLRSNLIKRNGRTYLTIMQGYRNEKGQSRSRMVKSLGYLDELQNLYTDPIAHFKKVAEDMTKEEKTSGKITITTDTNARLEQGNSNKKNYGHIICSKIYHEMGIDCFLDNKRRHANYKYNIEQIARLLIFSRILYPGSKRNACIIQREKFFDHFNFTIDDVYESLDEFNRYAQELQRHLHEKIVEQYDRKTDLIYYDVTNYYFEIDKEDDDRKRGACKEKRHDPIIQMGLAVDKNAIPIAYRLFAGNTHDSETYIPSMAAIKKEFGCKRIVVVADKGLNSGDNIAFSQALGDGYIFSQSIRGASEELKKYVLDLNDYSEGTDYKEKSRVIPTTINVTYKQEGKKKYKRQVPIDQKQIAFYSSKYAKRSKYKRGEVLAKAADLIKNPSKYTRTTHYGAAGYIKNIQFDAKTGVVITAKEKLILDIDKIAEEEKYDGYYVIVTSELDESDEKIIEAYHGLWHIEETFKITKSTLDARPIYLQNIEHINAHFLICFIALLILRLIELRMGNRFRPAQIAETLRQLECTYIVQNYYLFNFCDEVTKLMEKTFDVELSKKIISLGEIKKNLGNMKK